MTAIWRSFLLFRHQSHIASSASFIVTGFMKGDKVKLKTPVNVGSYLHCNSRHGHFLDRQSYDITVSGVGEVTGKTLMDLHSLTSLSLHAEVLM